MALGTKMPRRVRTQSKDADAAKEAKSPAIAPRSAIYDFVSLRGYTDLSPREEKQPIPSEENTDETSN